MLVKTLKLFSRNHIILYWCKLNFIVVTGMTSSRGIAEEVIPDLIVPIDVDALADKLIEILSMSHIERVNLEKAKKVAQSFVVDAEKSFLQALNDLELKVTL